MFLSRVGTRTSASLQVIRRGYAAATGNEMAFTFAAPYQVYYNKANIKQVDVPSFSGAFGILPNHVPTLAVLKPGVLSVTEGDSSIKKFFVSSGSITVNEDSSVQILAEEAVPLDMIDASAAQQELTAAQQELSRATGDKEKASAQIAVEVAEALVAATK
ncbi:ATP synthase subunit delta, mitochondrial [Folsomia candida]|uniref:ATP synthase subunit delta, mitochondrial n=1 Tax=Folsomia candida TaxID=158441 RepID=UPI000B8FD281|nr:ATP synthase subunit delta, mitochondrial [Folsomia candida]